MCSVLIRYPDTVCWMYYTRWTLFSIWHLRFPVQWKLDKTASVGYPFEDHGDLLMLMSSNVSVVVVSSGQWSEKREFLIRGVCRASRCIIAYKVVDTRLCCCGQCVSSGQWRGKREFLVRGVRRASRCINADTRFASWHLRSRSVGVGWDNLSWVSLRRS